MSPSLPSVITRPRIVVGHWRNSPIIGLPSHFGAPPLSASSQTKCNTTSASLNPPAGNGCYHEDVDAVTTWTRSEIAEWNAAVSDLHRLRREIRCVLDATEKWREGMATALEGQGELAHGFLSMVHAAGFFGQLPPPSHSGEAIDSPCEEIAARSGGGDAAAIPQHFRTPSPDRSSSHHIKLQKQVREMQSRPKQEVDTPKASITNTDKEDDTLSFTYSASTVSVSQHSSIKNVLSADEKPDLFATKGLSLSSPISPPVALRFASPMRGLTEQTPFSIAQERNRTAKGGLENNLTGQRFVSSTSSSSSALFFARGAQSFYDAVGGVRRLLESRSTLFRRLDETQGALAEFSQRLDRTAALVDDCDDARLEVAHYVSKLRDLRTKAQQAGKVVNLELEHSSGIEQNQTLDDRGDGERRNESTFGEGVFAAAAASAYSIDEIMDYDGADDTHGVHEESNAASQERQSSRSSSTSSVASSHDADSASSQAGKSVFKMFRSVLSSRSETASSSSSSSASSSSNSRLNSAIGRNEGKRRVKLAEFRSIATTTQRALRLLGHR